MKLMVVDTAINSILATVKCTEINAVSVKQTPEFSKNLEERESNSPLSVCTREYTILVNTC